MYTDALKLFSDYIRKGAKEYPQRDALIFKDKHITYPEFERNAERLAKYLVKNGVKKGDRIAYILPPRPEFFYLYVASSMIGAIIVGISARFTVDEVEYLINDAGADHAVVIANYGRDFQDIIGEVSKRYHFENIIIVDGEVKLPNAVAMDAILSNDYAEYNDLLIEREKQNKTEDGLLIVYTSGSTGIPKGALMSNRNIIHHGLAEAYELDLFQPDTVTLCHAPVNHVSGANLAGSAPLIANGTLVLLDMFHPAETLRLIQDHKVTFLGQVPTMYSMQFALPNFDEYDLSSLRVIGSSGAPAQAVLIEQIKARMCDNTRNALGMTEACGEVSYTEKGASVEVICNTVGKCPPGFERKIVDGDRNPVPEGTIGEVAFRSSTIVKGYFNKPEETAAAFDADGWFYTGDLGRIRPDGNLEIVGRVKEMYITGGYNVYPAEIENAIMRYPGVLTVAVLGIPNELMGEVGRAYIISKPDAELNGNEIMEYLKNHLADYKVPRDYVIRQSLPMTPLGKIEKKVLRDEIIEEYKEVAATKA